MNNILQVKHCTIAHSQDNLRIAFQGANAEPNQGWNVIDSAKALSSDDQAPPSWTLATCKMHSAVNQCSIFNGASLHAHPVAVVPYNCTYVNLPHCQPCSSINIANICKFIASNSTSGEQLYSVLAWPQSHDRHHTNDPIVIDALQTKHDALVGIPDCAQQEPCKAQTLNTGSDTTNTGIRLRTAKTQTHTGPDHLCKIINLGNDIQDKVSTSLGCGLISFDYCEQSQPVACPTPSCSAVTVINAETQLTERFDNTKLTSSTSSGIDRESEPSSLKGSDVTMPNLIDTLNSLNEEKHTPADTTSHEILAAAAMATMPERASATEVAWNSLRANSLPLQTPKSPDSQTNSDLLVRSKSPVQAPVLSPSQAPTSLPAQVPAELPSQIPINLPIQIPTAGPEQVPTLITAQTLSASPALVPAVQPEQAPTISPSQVPTFVPDLIPRLNPDHVPSAAPVQTPTELPNQVPVNTPAQIPSSPVQIPIMSPTLIPSLSPSQIPVASSNDVPALSPSQVPAEEGGQVGGNTPDQIPALPPIQVPAAELLQLPVLSPDQVPARTPSQVPGLSKAQLPSHSPDDMPNISFKDGNTESDIVTAGELSTNSTATTLT